MAKHGHSSDMFVINMYLYILLCFVAISEATWTEGDPCHCEVVSASPTTRASTPLSDNAGWMKDPLQVSDRIYYMGYKKFLTRQLFEYESLDDMVKGESPAMFYDLPLPVEGCGFVVYDRNLYYTPEDASKIVRFDLSTQEIEAELEIRGANHGGISPYGVDLSTDIDLAADVNGLWAIYATEDNGGNIVISRLKHRNLEIVKTWKTDYYKLSALNAFMVCGVLYTINYNSLKIDYMYNTTSGVGTKINVPLPGLTDTASAINYNFKEENLYIWDKKMTMTYRLNFRNFVPNQDTTAETITQQVTTVGAVVQLSTTLPPIATTTTSRVEVPSTNVTTVATAEYDAYEYIQVVRICLVISLLFLGTLSIAMFSLSALKRFKGDLNTIQKNRVLCIIFAEIAFYFEIDKTLVQNAHVALVALIQFGVLGTFTWSALEGYQLMAALNDLSERRDRWMWYYAIGYGAPSLTVAVTAAVDRGGYELEFEESLIWAFVAPCCLGIVCSVLFLGVAIHRLNLFWNTVLENTKHGDNRLHIVRCLVSMFLLCGMCGCAMFWLYELQPPVTSIIFCTLLSLHGISTFLFLFVLSPEVRVCIGSCGTSGTQQREFTRHPHTRSYHLSMSASRNRADSRTQSESIHRDSESDHSGFHPAYTAPTATLLPVRDPQSEEWQRMVRESPETRALNGLRTISERSPNLQYDHVYMTRNQDVFDASTMASSASGPYNRLHENCMTASHRHPLPRIAGRTHDGYCVHEHTPECRLHSLQGPRYDRISYDCT